MTGCERCGAQALSGEAECPVCGAALRPAGAGGRVAPRIPVRRHGKVPPPPPEILVEPAGSAAVSLMALGLGGLGAALIAGGVGYWLW